MPTTPEGSSARAMRPRRGGGADEELLRLPGLADPVHLDDDHAFATGSQCQSATRDLAVGRLDDLGGFPDGLVPDSGIGVGEGSFGGVKPGGN